MIKKQFTPIYICSIVDGAIGAAGQVLSAGIGAISGAVQGKKEREFNAEQAQLNRDFQREERELVQQWNLDQWNRENEYNSLASQLERAKEAGVSPNAIIGGSPTQFQASPVRSSPSSGAQASYSSALPSALVGNIANIGSGITESILQLTQAKEAQSRIGLNEQEYAYNDATFEQRVKSCEANLNNIVASTGKIIAETNKTISEDKKIEVDTQVVKATLPFIVDKEIAELEIAKATAKEIAERTKQLRLNGAMTRSLQNSEMKLNNLKSEVVKVESKVAEATADDKIDQSHYETSLLQLKKEFSDAYGVPLDTPEFAFLWHLNENGLLGAYIDEVVGSASYAESYNSKKGKSQVFWEQEGLRVLIDFMSLFVGGKSIKNPRPRAR